MPWRPFGWHPSCERHRIMESQRPGLLEQIRVLLNRSLFLRTLFVGALVALLHVPIAFIARAVSERHTTRLEASTEVTRTWGGSQTLAGPVLTIPRLEQ